MKYSIIIDKDRDEEVIIYAHSPNETVKRLEEILNQDSQELIGYCDDEMVIIIPDKVICFIVEDSRCYALTDKGKYLLKQRLYQIEEGLGERFVKINQSCIVNVKMIDCFKTSLGGSLMVIMKGGHRDYVSRRRLKAVKERIGF